MIYQDNDLSNYIDKEEGDDNLKNRASSAIPGESRPSQTDSHPYNVGVIDVS